MVGLLRDSIDMGNPGQAPCYCNSKVLSCFTTVRLSQIQPQSCSLMASSWRDTLSNALLKSSKTPSICTPCSNAAVRSCVLSETVFLVGDDLVCVKVLPILDVDDVFYYLAAS